MRFTQYALLVYRTQYALLSLTIILILIRLTIYSNSLNYVKLDPLS